ncbi:hypothetical protein [Enterococcus termitis]|uniref:RES domain-containing protein n=1 Tax=Enterococcus termitis TaxID=332950 RepID=A0A1E5GB07_9ENTE|nr:hypothetical protein [Enterococcus termitis]OEG09869.1 hypothetical protein BCR25_10215 [Enterococcus termitis]OJG98374.1 hypothetical protein RV18_GL003275 [Enterococcus termitis]
MEKITKIQQKLSDFEKFLSPELTEEEISIKLMETFDQSKILIKSGEYNPGSKFYRARIIDSPNMDSLKSWKKQDFWGVPKEKISSYGRLNKPKESVFYLSAEPLQTLKEIGLESYDDQRYAVISCFETKKSFVSVYIGDHSSNSLDEKETIISNLYSSFFRNNFSKPVGNGTEYLYILSNAIVKNFYDLPSEVIQAWTYPAVENLNCYNVAFKSHVASTFLRYKGSIVVRRLDENLVIPICFNSNYQRQRVDIKWIKDEFNLDFHANDD